jgi:hypothetical protein
MSEVIVKEVVKPSSKQQRFNRKKKPAVTEIDVNINEYKQNNNQRSLNNRRRRMRQRSRKLSAGLEASGVSSADDFVSYESNRFAEAVVNPFHEGAIGAVMPDRWTPPTIPAMDIINMTIKANSIIDASAGLNLLGIYIAFVPRSLAVGWMETQGDGFTKNPVFYADTNFNATGSAGAPDPRKVAGNLYCLMVSFIVTSTAFPDPIFGAIEQQIPPFFIGSLTRGFNFIETSRFQTINGLSDGGRIVGAGIKVNTQANLLETGGTAYGGWMSIDDLYKQCAQYADFSTIPPTSPLEVQDLLKLKSFYKAIDGISVRYSPLQSAIQQKFVEIYPSTSFALNDAYPAQSNGFVDGSSVGAHDAIGGGDFVPAVVWLFNTSGDLNAHVYDLQVELRVHLQCEPKGICPFVISHVVPDPEFLILSRILGNPDVFDVAVKGASFVSFYQKFKEIVAKSGKYLAAGTTFMTRAQAFQQGLLRLMHVPPVTGVGPRALKRYYNSDNQDIYAID